MEVNKENFEDVFKMACLRLPDHITINLDGLWRKDWTQREVDKIECSEHTIKIINWLIQNIPKHFQKHNNGGKKYWNANSRNGSYNLEKIIADGIHNRHGHFILAMLILGYEMKLPSDKYLYLEPEKDCREIYVTFNSSFRDLSKHTCACGQQYTTNSKLQHQKSKTHQLIMKVIMEAKNSNPKV